MKRMIKNIINKLFGLKNKSETLPVMINKQYLELLSKSKFYQKTFTESWLGHEVVFMTSSSDHMTIVKKRGVIISEYLDISGSRLKIYYTIVDTDNKIHRSISEDSIPEILGEKMADKTSWHSCGGTCGELSQEMINNISDSATNFLQEKINDYCSSWCIQECSKDCPLKIYKR